MTKRAKIEAMEKEVRDAAWRTTEYEVNSAIQSAYENAADTVKSEDHPDFFNLAYDTIGFTEEYQTKREVRDWFAARGYVA